MTKYFGIKLHALNLNLSFYPAFQYLDEQLFLKFNC
jgi:hypothetical protein